MEMDYLMCLVVLDRERDWARTAEICEVSEAALAQTLAAAEARYGHAIVRPGPGFQGFTPEGERVLGWAKDLYAAHAELQEVFHASQRKARVAPLLARRSVSPKRLCAPGPDAAEVELMVQAALRAPDHGSLHPWRVLEFHAQERALLADRFKQEKRRRDPLASPADLRLAREHATRPPVLLAFIVSPKARTQVPVQEQWLAAGAALGNLLNAAHQFGYGAIMLSGERCHDAVLRAELGVGPEEFLAGFVSLGSVAHAPPREAAHQPRRGALALEPWHPRTPDRARARRATATAGLNRPAGLPRPPMFHPSEGCCDGSAPMCHASGELLVGDRKTGRRFLTRSRLSRTRSGRCCRLQKAARRPIQAARRPVGAPSASSHKEPRPA